MNHSDIEKMAQGFPPSVIGKDYEEVITFLAKSLLNALAALTAPDDWKQRAEAAEAKLAELAKQPPVGNFYEDGPGNWWQIGPHDKVPHVTPLFDRPAPAADQVPEGWRLVPVTPDWGMLSADGCKEHHNGQSCLHHDNRRRIWAAMLAAAPNASILRNIEEMSK